MRRALGALSVACRAVALCLVALAVLDLVLPTGARTWLLGVNGMVTRLLPDAVSGVLVLRTPLGGALRGDYVIAALALAVAGRLCRLAGRSLARRGRG